MADDGEALTNFVQCSECKAPMQLKHVLDHPCFAECGGMFTVIEGEVYPVYEEENGGMVQKVHDTNASPKLHHPKKRKMPLLNRREAPNLRHVEEVTVTLEENPDIEVDKCQSMGDYWTTPVDADFPDVAELMMHIVLKPERQKQLKDNKRTRKDELWREIYTELKDRGFPMSQANPGLKVKEKYYNMVAAYQRFKKHESKMGDKRCPKYFSALDDVFTKTTQDSGASSSEEPSSSDRVRAKRRFGPNDDLIQYLRERDEAAAARNRDMIQVFKKAMKEELELRKRDLDLREREAAHREEFLKILLEKNKK